MLKILIAGVALTVILLGCSGDESFPIEPYIEFQRIQFVEVSDPTRGDTIIFSFHYRDGDMDLGLSESMVSNPYHYQNFFLEDHGVIRPVATARKFDDLGDFISPSPNETGTLVTLRTRKQAEYDTLPAFNCVNYFYFDSAHVLDDRKEIIGEANAYRRSGPGRADIYTIFDTLLIAPNPNFYNLQVDYLVEQRDGSFSKFDFATPCGVLRFDARIPQIDLITSNLYSRGAFKIARESKYAGVITYGMRSTGFHVLFGGKRIKLRFTIRDRALHTSNTVESDILSIPTN